MKKIAIIFGTRPEAIKLAPVILKLQKLKKKFKTIVISTGQHREMLYQVIDFFRIKVNCDFKIMKMEQNLDYIVTNVVKKLYPVLEAEKPDLVIVQGDTTSAFISSLSAFYKKIPVAHVEAGLRSFDKFNPFPEEINRKLIDSISEIHFAPTKLAKENLINEGFNPERIYVTGNTVVDALFIAKNKAYEFEEPILKNLKQDKKIILVTVHRRENLGEPLKRICKAIREISRTRSDVKIVFPVHLNPKVKRVVYSILNNHANVYLVKPLSYSDLIKLMHISYIILTDSGGIQEEAPSFGKPVLVTRETTERMEAINAGVAKLVGTETEKIIKEVNTLLNSKEKYIRMSKMINPFGDGKASDRILKILESIL